MRAEISSDSVRTVEEPMHSVNTTPLLPKKVRKSAWAIKFSLDCLVKDLSSYFCTSNRGRQLFQQRCSEKMFHKSLEVGSIFASAAYCPILVTHRRSMASKLLIEAIVWMQYKEKVAK